MLISPGYQTIDHYLYTYKPCRRYAAERARLATIARTGRIYSRLHQYTTPKLVKTVTTVTKNH